MIFFSNKTENQWSMIIYQFGWIPKTQFGNLKQITFAKFRQTNFATRDKYILQFWTNTCWHLEWIHFAVWEHKYICQYLRQIHWSIKDIFFQFKTMDGTWLCSKHRWPGKGWSGQDQGAMAWHARTVAPCTRSILLQLSLISSSSSLSMWSWNREHLF